MIEMLNSLADKWFAWEVSILWQASLLIAIVWSVDLIIRKWAWPQVRYALWLLVLVKLTLTPALTSPASIVSSIMTFTEKKVAVQITAPQEIIRSPVTPTNPSLQQNFQAVAPAITSQTNLPPVVPAAPSLSPKAYAMFLWLAGVIFLSSWLFIRLRNLRQEHFDSEHRSKLPERFYETLEATAARLNLKHLPQVILTDKVSCPAVFGIFKPVLLMPADKLSNLTHEDMEHILLHELAHIKRGDLFVHAIYMSLQIAYWFNPLLWITRKHLQNLRELCCDATVARVLKDKTYRYRETLLETARQLLAEPVDPGLGLLGLFENSNWLVDRLKWLEKKTWKNRPVRITTIFIIVCLMATCVIPMAKFTPKAPELVIKGVVTDAATGEPIAGAKVFDDGYADDPDWDNIRANARSEWGAITNLQGEYSFLTYPEHHGIKADAKGYKAKRESLYSGHFTLNKNDEEIIDFSLSPGKTDSKFIKEINGCKIDLVGINVLDGGSDSWWLPDGSKSEYEIETTDHSKYPAKYPGYKIAIKVDGKSGCGEIRVGVKGQRQQSGLTVVNPEGVFAVRSHIKPRYKKTNVKVGVLVDQWKTVASHNGHGTTNRKVGKRQIIYSPAVQGEGGKVYITISDDLDLKFARRIVAVDKQGNEFVGKLTAGMSVNDRYQQTCEFAGVSRDSIKEFQFQTQDYQWVEFMGVSLKADFKIDTSIEVEDTATENKKIEAESPDVKDKTTVVVAENFSADLPLAGKVELVSVSEFLGKEKKCWAPDGTELQEPIYSEAARYRRRRKEKREIGFVFRFSKNVKLSFEDFGELEEEVRDRSKHWGGGHRAYGEDGKEVRPPGVGYFNFGGPTDKTEPINIRVRLQKNEWTSGASYDGKYIVGKVDPKIDFVEAYNTAGGSKLVFKSGYKDVDTMVKIDYIPEDFKTNGRRRGTEESYARSATSVNGEKVFVANFNVKLENITEFRVKTRQRDYEYVQFKNVALRPKPEAQDDEKKPEISVNPPSGSTMSLISEIEVVFNQPMIPDLGRIVDTTKSKAKSHSPFAKVKTFSDNIKYDPEQYKFTIPLILPPDWEGSFELREFRSADGVEIEPVAINYSTGREIYSAKFQKRFQQAKQSDDLRDVLNKVKETRLAITSLSETVKTAHKIGDSDQVSESIFKFQGQGQFYADISEIMNVPFYIGSDGKDCWYYNGREGKEKLVTAPFDQVAEKNILIGDLFGVTQKGVPETTEKFNIEYLGTGIYQKRKHYILRTWSERLRDDYIWGTANVAWIDAETYMVSQMISDHGSSVMYHSFVYGLINQPIADSEFEPKHITDIKRSAPRELDDGHDTRFLNIIDGSNGRMSVRWGEQGSGGKISSGLN